MKQQVSKTCAPQGAEGSNPSLSVCLRQGYDETSPRAKTALIDNDKTRAEGALVVRVGELAVDIAVCGTLVCVSCAIFQA